MRLVKPSSSIGLASSRSPRWQDPRRMAGVRAVGAKAEEPARTRVPQSARRRARSRHAEGTRSTCEVEQG